jgi:O-antigen/teichoic acid export membrane protein
MRTRISPIKKNILASFTTIAVQLLNQIVLVPFYLTFWDVNLYSDWIVLMAIVSFFAMSDVGLNNVTINRFVIKYSEGNYNECKSLLINNFFLIFIVGVICIVTSLMYINFVDIVKVLGLHSLSRIDANYILIVLLLKIFVGLLSSVFGGIYNATQNTYKAILLTNLSILAEFFVIFVALLFQLPIVTLVSIYLLPKLLLFLYFLIDANKYFAFSFKLKYFDFKLLKEVMIPSVSFMSFPFAYTVIFQGFTLLVNKYFGANSVILFNTTRTMANFIKTLLSSVQNSVWPEYSIAFGKSDFNRMRILHRKTLVISTTISTFLCVFLLFFGDFIYEIWTHGKIQFDLNLMIAFLMIVFVQSFWTSSSITLMATNNHTKLGGLFLSLSLISLTVAYVLLQIFPNIILTTSCMLLIDLGIAVYAINRAVELTQDSVNELISYYKTFYLLTIRNIFK